MTASLSKVVLVTSCLFWLGGCDASSGAQSEDGAGASATAAATAATATAATATAATATAATATAARAKPAVLEPTFLTRALMALDEHLSKEARLLEIRANATTVELQLVVDDGVESIIYRETPRSSDQQLAPAKGQVEAPVQVPVYGNGDLEENSFGPKDVKLDRITHAFPVAVKAIDPLDGWVREIVVRRNMPFGRAVRARIYIESPRMSGSIDTNASGIPLK